IVVILGGTSSTGKASVSILGHEGGVSFPQLDQVISGPYQVQKSKEGLEYIEVTLDQPLELRNNQFFINVFGAEAGVQVMAEVGTPLNMCSSSSGGEYYKLFFRKGSQWSLGNRRAMAAVLVKEDLPLPEEKWFKDMTETAGFPLTLSNKNIATADLNGDGWLDIVVGGRVYFNQQNFNFSDETDRLGYDATGISIHPIIDMNNDGKPDILLLYTDSALQKVLMNQGGGNFTEQSLSAMIPVRGVSSYSIADINQDGFPDIFVGRLWTMYPSTGPDITPNYLFLNDGNGSFNDASSMIYNKSFTHRRSRGSAWCDYDNDGDLDLYVTNYFLEPDELWRNNGDGTFTDMAGAAGLDRNKFNQSSHGTGVDWGDYDNDGDFDLLVPMLAHPGFTLQYDHLPTQLYRNGGAPAFLFYRETAESGIEYEETHAGGAWGDIDNDGDLDFAITTFYGCRYIDLYRQDEPGKFTMISSEAGIQNIVSGEDVCWADWDHDGKLDLASGDGGKFRIWKNNVPSWEEHWTEIELRATNGNKLAIGARVQIYAGGKTYMQEVTAGRGVRMQKPARLHFGLNKDTKIDSVVVRWPGQTVTEQFTNVEVDALNFLSEGGQTTLNVQRSLGESLHVFPNPVRRGQSLQVNTSVFVSMDVYTMLGTQVGTLSFENGHSEALQVAPGTYVLKGLDGVGYRFQVMP
ncbi:MAG: CRTAC1 family protein, partial [Bacteroidota bacterium]|nr:CRTAC1 family protein [Bacteroidota bacterium]MDX5430433.1 CRTAC1 family protein [Bacteroidota bacterium]MDX5469192.1 CRTAC1 family protein [Bacteroidota bacterium]